MATPEPSSDSVPRDDVPSWNSTVPVGTAAPDAPATVAVSVILAPTVMLVAELCSAVGGRLAKTGLETRERIVTTANDRIINATSIAAEPPTWMALARTEV